MTSRERLLALMTGKLPDRTAWAPLIDGYYVASLPADFQRDHFGFVLEDYTTASQLSDELSRRIIDFTRLIGADILQRHAPGLKSYTGDLTIEEIPEEKKIRRRFVTSVGVLTDVVYSVPESPNYPFYGVEYRLKTVEDLRVYRHIWENVHFEPAYQAFLDEDAAIGDDGLAMIDVPQSAVQLLLGEEAGVTNFYYLLQDYPVEMDNLIETIHSKIREACEIIARSPAQVAIAMEDLSSTTSSPAIFERYSWRHLNEYADILHAEGKIFLAHMCGLLKAMAPLIAQSKLDGVESLTSPPLGDLSVTEARRCWGEKFIIVGGLNAHVMLETDQDKVRAAVLEALEQAKPGFNFILSNGDAVPYGASLETMRTIAQTVKDCGNFPLR
jgi:hypothetical protein